MRQVDFEHGSVGRNMVQSALPMLVAGCVGALLGCWAAGMVPQQWLSRLFGGLLLVLSVRELLACFKKNAPLHNPPHGGAN